MIIVISFIFLEEFVKTIRCMM